MPIYEYEPVDRDCLLCEGRIEAIQGIDEQPFEFCPYCGLSVRRIISRASIQVSKKVSADAASRKGFSTFRKAGKGVWEKVAGPDTPDPGPASEDDPEDGQVDGGNLKV